MIAEIDRLLDNHNYGEIASILNQRGLRSGVGLAFDSVSVGVVRRAYLLKTRYDRLRERGLLTLAEIAKILGVCKDTVKHGVEQVCCGAMRIMTSTNACTKTLVWIHPKNPKESDDFLASLSLLVLRRRSVKPNSIRVAYGR